MKKINAMNILLFNIIVFVLLVILYLSTFSSINDAKNYLIETQSLYASYKNSKESLLVKKDVILHLKSISKKLNINNMKIEQKSKKVVIYFSSFDLKTQEKLLNEIFNERFIILKCKIGKNTTMIEIGTN